MCPSSQPEAKNLPSDRTAALEIRQVGPGDAHLFQHVAPDVFDEPIHADRLAAYLAEPNHMMLVALWDGEIVAQVAAVVHRHPDKVTELYIDEVGVTPSLHRQGIARRMLDRMFALGQAQGCGEAWVGTELDNLPAKGLYESRGARGETFVMYVYEL
jgi:aminoglycoside 6'-N-acetyltransferase I